MTALERTPGQASMAVDTVLLAFERNGVLDATEVEALHAKAEALFEATENEERYRQDEFVRALRALQASAP